MKRFRALLALAVVSAVLATCMSATIQAKGAATGKWVTNGIYALQVTRVQTVGKWQKLAPFQRIGKGDEAQFADIKSKLASGRYKVVVVHMAMRNDSKEKQVVGYSRNGNNTGMRGSVSEVSSVLFLRGKDGTEVDSLNVMQVDDNYAGSAITYFLEGGLPMKSEVPSKGTIRGRVAFVVRDWFVPARLFIKGWYSGAEKKPEVAVPVK